MKRNWTPITSLDNIPVREGRAVNLDGRELAIFNLDGKFMAVDNRCPHRGGPLADGIVAGNHVVCPLHGWKVCLENGRVTKPETPACVLTYRTRVKNGLVWVEVPEDLELARTRREEVAA